ncbi:hypothetical protein BWD07_04620 [Neisseria canis]|nr:hypothetical protein BWD07_04620 [Neisseria canis]
MKWLPRKIHICSYPAGGKKYVSNTSLYLAFGINPHQNNYKPKHKIPFFNLCFKKITLKTLKQPFVKKENRLQIILFKGSLKLIRFYLHQNFFHIKL